MKSFLTSHIMMTVHLMVLAGAVSLGAWVAHHDKASVVEHIRERIDEQVALIATIAETTRRNGGDTVVSSIIQDCPRRTEFDLMLGNLNALSPKELIAMQQLFESCGSFFAERKALMVSRLEREYEVLENDVALLEILTGKTFTGNNFDTWSTLVELEGERSKGLSELTSIQEDIIVTLIRNDAESKKNIQSLVASAHELNESLAVISTLIEELHNTIID